MSENDNTANQEFGAGLRAMREEAGVGLSELARRTGLARSHLYRLEDGTSAAPTVETVNAIAEALDVDPEDIYDLMWQTLGTGHELPTTATYFRARHNLDDDQIAAVERTLKRVTNNTKGGTP